MCLQTFAAEVIKEAEVTLAEEFIPCHFGEIEVLGFFKKKMFNAHS